MRLFVFGMGYTATRLAHRLIKKGWQVAGTSRNQEAANALRAQGIDAYVFDGDSPIQDFNKAITGATHVLISNPPGEGGDPALLIHGNDLASRQSIAWLGYLSTTGVYGDHKGAWVDESTACSATSTRGKRRVSAEQGWMALHQQHGLPVHLFRLPGIYGPGRSAIDAIRQGRTQRIDKAGQVFCRIHVDDIVEALFASMNTPHPGGIYNLVDNEPAPPQDVTAFAAQLLGQEPAPLIPFDEAELTPMGRSFYAENKRVRNQLMKDELGITLQYPTYREGLRALLSQE